MLDYFLRIHRNPLFDIKRYGQGIPFIIDTGKVVFAFIGREGDFMKIGSSRDVVFIQMPENKRLRGNMCQFKRNNSFGSIHLFRNS